jgi:hypothetical protein
MIDHRRAAELSAVALDFPLSAAERTELGLHLRGCRECAAMDAALRADAARVRGLPQLDAPGEVRAVLAWAAEGRVSGRAGGSRPMLLLAAALLVALTAVGTVVAGSLLLDRDRSNVLLPDATALPSTSADTEPSVEATPTASATASPSATPLPGPEGPLAELVPGGWARVAVAELNVRARPDLAADSSWRLVEGAVMHVAEGPERGPEGYDWYRVASLGLAVGWIASGTLDEPFATTLVAEGDLLRCGPVTSSVLSVADGQVSAHDPFRIGEYALPAAAFDNEALGAFELLRATQGEACFVASLEGDGTPSVAAEVGYYACGHPVVEDGIFRLRPAPGMDAVPDILVKDVAIIDPAIGGYGGTDEVMAVNAAALLRLMAGGNGEGCISHGIHGGRSGGSEVDGRACGVVESATSTEVVVRPADSDTPVTFRLSPGSFDPSTPLGVTIGLYVDVHNAINARQMGIRADPFPC